MPIIGEVRTGRELGNNRLYNKYIWAACLDCNKERWTGFDGGVVDALRCMVCANRIRAKNNPHLFKGGEYQGFGFKKGVHSAPEHEFKKGHPAIYIPIGSSRPEISGSNHPNWKGGITPLAEAARHSTPYSEWRRTVFERDNFTCQKCGQYGGVLNAHHDSLVSKAPLFMLEISNGITLCKECHKMAHRKGGDVKRKRIRK